MDQSKASPTILLQAFPFAVALLIISNSEATHGGGPTVSADGNMAYLFMTRVVTDTLSITGASATSYGDNVIKYGVVSADTPHLKPFQ
jgi:hypothetical protein